MSRLTRATKGAASELLNLRLTPPCRMDRCGNRRIHKSTLEPTDRRNHGRTDGRRNQWTNAHTKGCMDQRQGTMRESPLRKTLPYNGPKHTYIYIYILGVLRVDVSVAPFQATKVQIVGVFGSCVCVFLLLLCVCVFVLFVFFCF